MTVTPLPRRGIALEGRDRAGRVLRVSSHPKTGRTVLSILEDNTCRATVRLSPADVAELIGALANGIAEPSQHEKFESNVG